MPGITVWELRRFVRQARCMLPDCCPLGCIFPELSNPPASFVSEKFGISYDYCVGVTMGWDGIKAHHNQETSSLSKGYRFGSRMAKLFKNKENQIMQTSNQINAASKNELKKLAMIKQGVKFTVPRTQGFVLEVRRGGQWARVDGSEILDRARDHSELAEKLAGKNRGIEYRVRRTDGTRAVLKFSSEK